MYIIDKLKVSMTVENDGRNVTVQSYHVMEHAELRHFHKKYSSNKICFNIFEVMRLRK